jgi:cell filamentation protein, protein adenylyltransferase
MTAISFSANYRRYTPELAQLLMRISEALGVIRGARVLPAVADQLRASAKAGTVHYSNLIEGNELPLVEAERAARGELGADTRAKIELVNYVAALDLIDERLAAGALELTPGFLKGLHATTMRGLGRDGDQHFKPHHEGEWRDGSALVVDRISGQVMHEAPPPEEVPGRMEGMFEWLDSKLSAKVEPSFVLAGVMHYGITDVHPFADGNGRAARLMQTALLMKTDVLPGRMFSFEGYYARDRHAYYDGLRSVRRNTFNQESWLEYFLRGLAEEYERVAATAADIGSLMSSVGNQPLRLTLSQQRGLVALRIAGRREFSRRQYEEAAGVARSAAGVDLRGLVQHGVLTTRGSTSATRYAFPGVVQSSPTGKRRGRPASWDETRIERELQDYLGGHSTWPSWDEFRASGRADLYSAASRNGGIARWRRILGM